MANLIILVVVFAVIAFLGGVKYKNLNDKLNTLIEQKKEDNYLEEQPTILDVTPQAVSKRLHSTDFNEEESAIVKIRSPEEMRKDKERAISEQIAHLK